MKVDEFNRIVEEQIDRCRGMLVKKADEYATTDRLHNFKVAAALQGQTMEEALGGMMAKHTVSIYDMIANGGPYSEEIWDEKITDHINYLLILRAVVEEVELHGYQATEVQGHPVQG